MHSSSTFMLFAPIKILQCRDQEPAAKPQKKNSTASDHYPVSFVRYNGFTPADSKGNKNIPAIICCNMTQKEGDQSGNSKASGRSHIAKTNGHPP